MKNLLLFLIPFLFCFTGSILPEAYTPRAGASSPTVLRIGYMNNPGFLERMPDGRMAGYCADYLREISYHTGWQYAYIFDTPANLEKRFQAGDIDLLCSYTKTPARMAQYDFSRYPLGLESTLLYTMPTNSRAAYEEYSAMNGMRIAVIPGSYQQEALRLYAQKHGFHYIEVPAETNQELFYLLQEAAADAVCTCGLYRINGYKLLGRLDIQPFFIMVRKNRPDLLLEQLDTALGEIHYTKPLFEVRLANRHYGSTTTSQGLPLTREEMNYIQEHPIIRVGHFSDRFPFSRLNQNTGKLDGIVIDLLQLIAEKTHLQFENIAVPIGTMPLDFLAAGNADLISGIVENNERLSDPTLHLSIPYFEGQVAFAGLKGKPFDLQEDYCIAIPGDAKGIAAYIRETHPNYTILGYPSTPECIDAVLRGKADFVMQNTYILGHLLQKPQFEDLALWSANAIADENFSFVSTSSQDPRLISIMNKALAALDKNEIHGIVLKHTLSEPYQYTLHDFLYKYRLTLFVGGLSLLCCLVLAGYAFRQKQRNIAILESSNEQLSTAIAQAKAASQAKSQFLSRMSHEIRTPLNAIIGLTAIAGKHLDNRRCTESYLSKIGLASRMLLSIINDILDMSAIESSKLKIARLPFNLKHTLSGIAEMYYLQCQSKQLDFSLSTTDLTDEILIGDQGRLNQILLNLLSNAVKFTLPGGRVQVQVIQQASDETTVHLRFLVKDTGIGMDEEVQARLFQPFEQASAAIFQKFGGSGLGLAITKNLTDLMGGSIQLESTLGQGSTFQVELPFGRTKNKLPHLPGSLEELQVLVIDDDADTRQYLEKVLTRMGIHCQAAASGTEGLALCRQAAQAGNTIDLCFIDWRMPDIDGLTVCQELAAILPATRRVIISAYDMNEAVQQAKEAGADAFITKPLFQSTIFNLLLDMHSDTAELTGELFPEDNLDFHGRRILLVEDNALNMEIAHELLHATGAEITTASNGQEAVDLFLQSAAGEYDVILMDIQMPVMNGYEAARAIRASQHPDAQRIPILAMTANAFAEDISAALAAGMNRHIAKPIDVKVLFRTLREVFLTEKKTDFPDSKM